MSYFPSLESGEVQKQTKVARAMREHGCLTTLLEIYRHWELAYLQDSNMIVVVRETFAELCQYNLENRVAFRLNDGFQILNEEICK